MATELGDVAHVGSVRGRPVRWAQRAAAAKARAGPDDVMLRARAYTVLRAPVRGGGGAAVLLVVRGAAGALGMAWLDARAAVAGGIGRKWHRA